MDDAASGSRLRRQRLERLETARLYVVTDSRESQGDLDSFLEAVLSAGADIVQLRAKNAEAGDVMKVGTKFREAASEYGALFMVNDRPDIALALDADGVHLGQNDVSTEIARRIVGRESIIGLSCHSAEDHAQASPEADYLTAGPVYATPTKPGRAAVGLGLVESAARTITKPWFAIGGIDSVTIGEVVGAGATRVALVRAVTGADDPALAVRQLLQALSPT